MALGVRGWDRTWCEHQAREVPSLLTLEDQSLQSCRTLGSPMDCSPPGSPVRGMLLAGMLEWVAVASSLLTLAGDVIPSHVSHHLRGW